ncbi:MULTISPECIES: ClpXP protease specificity-enhancing factor [Haliea]|jgi:stringent starvation protein B|uniref:ClpXP protease specificity-enhancing factor n=1 Tax=Haliea TaxID=475794 RepID=UPI0004881A0E|nr:MULTISPECIES: ClpXP protease specificity-enhancing factor [Haliea]HAN69491.1 ClpXP protease specificity-enhancing factor [Halieaceae bacterium]MAY93792.1 ClpXP protease specificity-enhancing factor [Haliea sp.]MBK41551.1 ClpXP protease specificity-enhancing factor [Haliea sp.]MBP70814.1 ClpXP protease specificity-enhancing factor [Haliea sp.]HBM82378.1 ClpXP protease specificity-enhancing factor [Halieaceae bacterium]
MTPSRPYIMRALYEWIVDNDCTPYLLVDARRPGVEVPSQYVKDGQIVLNVSPSAVIELLIGNEWISFNGRFGGTPTDILLPVGAVIGIYARENGQGMVFEAEESPEPPDDPSGDDGAGATSKPEGRPSLKIVK